MAVTINHLFNPESYLWKQIQIIQINVNYQPSKNISKKLLSVLFEN